MKKLLSLAFGITLFVCFIVSVSSVSAEDSASLEVVASAICKNVVNHEPVDAGVAFSTSDYKLYCFSKIVGAAEPTGVVHVWYFGDVERASIYLNVKAASWRTHSSKIIQAHEVGSWRVEIIDSAGNLLETLKFEVTP